MSNNVSTGSARSQPSTLSTKSFTRYEPPSPATERSRASTLQPTPPIKSPKFDNEHEDVFDGSANEQDPPPLPDTGRSQSLPERFDELPIELASLTDR